MIIEVIAVGTELLLGQIINSNAADIGHRLAEDGFDAHYQVTVGDNLDRLVNAIETASARADAVVMTGGIGPTQDDMTREAVAAVLGVDIVTDQAHAVTIHDLLAARGVVADSALRMADYPAGTTPLPNSKGFALGIAADFNGTPVFAVPGVPSEMRAMIDEQVRPRLRAASGDPSVLINRVLHCYGLGESQIAERLDDLYQSVNPSLAFLINGPEVRVRLTAKATTEAEAEDLIAGVEAIVRKRLGPVVFGTDGQTVDGIVGRLLAERGWTVSVAESLTAGAISTRLSAIPNFSGAAVVPATGGVAGRPPQEALLLADEAPPADVRLAIGSVHDAGPDEGNGVTGRQVGFAIRTPSETFRWSLDFTGDRERIHRFAVPTALHLLRQVLADDHGGGPTPG